MNNPPTPPSSGLNLGDVYHTLFRHKWKILAVWVVGLAAAAALKFLWPVKYQSTAELLVRYVLDNKSVTPVGAASNIQTPDQRGDSIMSSEAQLLGSFDLALQVADTIGPSNILAKAGGGTDRFRAAGVIESGLKVDAPKGSAVLDITFEHSDPAMVQPILTQLIASYLKMHAAVHQAGGTLDDALTQETDQLRSQLQQTEQDLKNAKLKVGVLSLDDAKKTYADQLGTIQEALSSAQAELAAREAALAEMTNLMSSPPVTTNTAAKSSAPAAAAEPPPDKVAQYRQVCTLLDTLDKVEQNRLLQFQPGSPRVVEIQKQIDQNQAVKAQLEKQYPQLVATQVLDNGPTAQPPVTRQELFAELTKVKSLQARIAVLNQQLTGVQKQMDAVANAEGNISDLQRKLALQATNYMYLSASLEKSRIDEALSAGRISGISTIESPTPPALDVKKLNKALLIVLFGAIAGGLGLAFAIELYLDRSFKRPIEIENKLQVPLFLSIPRSRLNGHHRLAGPEPARRLLSAGNGSETTQRPVEASALSIPTNGAPWNADHVLRSHFETLRDRLILYFEARNLTHKPKLVAVTSCSEGSGVSTIASGLAACLSETGDGNVLLVDMNEVNGSAAAYFHKGKLECGLDDALESEKRDSAMVHDNLYVVSEKMNNGNGHLPKILHKRFSSLMPKLRASDYDYIIFDMPPVSQISPTTRLARFMDMVFMVVEAERTDRDVVKRATDMLTETKANVGVVLNKSRSYVPRALQQEL